MLARTAWAMNRTIAKATKKPTEERKSRSRRPSSKWNRYSAR